MNTLEIKGFNPFIDSPEEYHPQYSKDFILKMILLFKLYLPKVELKIQYASNKNNYIPDFIKLNVDSISGIYTPFMNDKLKNTKEISKYIKK